jgi:hypothetical protein
MTADLFFPPGVQREFFRLVPEKPLPRIASAEIHSRMAALWQRRNKCAESELDDIDADMLRIAVTVSRNLPLPPEAE